ncbi:MAG TPA: TatD family hydrolase [Clostridia bacterium]|nr:TatD family hydrolase [Clostridia bacterium]
MISLLIDSHAHLDDGRFSADRDQVIGNAQDEGIKRIINVGVDLKTSKAALDLANEYEIIFAAAGVHPHNASRYTAETTEQLSNMLAHDKVVAVGEIGLDYYRNISPPKTQRRVFREQLSLAREKDLPVIIHDRDAHKDVLDILVSDGLPKVGGVLHCFSGNWEFAQNCLDLGMYISFAGPITFRNAGDLTETAVRAPLDRVLVETDCPYLSPEPHRGKRNEPANVRYVADKIASLRDLKIGVLKTATADNTCNLFYKIF